MNIMGIKVHLAGLEFELVAINKKLNKQLNNEQLIARQCWLKDTISAYNKILENANEQR